MKIPATFSEWFEEYDHKEITDAIKESKYSNSMKWEGDKLRITQALFDSFFQPACAGIIDHVNHLLEKPNVRGTQTILMVGGFSESLILQARIRAAFPDFRVVVPNDAGLAVLKGAVLFGHNPRVIMARVAKYTYGFASFEKFNHKIHSKEKKISMNGKDFCKDIFDVHVRKGASLHIDEAQAKRPYEVNREDQTELDLELYVSYSDEVPKYVTDPGCHYLGTLKAQVPKPKKGTKHGVNVQLIFGGTELRVKAENMSNGDVTSAEFNFLGEEP
ncbi:heat shock 70 kDa protein 12B-like [Saccostrea cucullata]|uniref:heat shock 70 kDa protein 12B-like n=1 Tax=Saccostrea cuccullata TaxID=36930 RepID=UPI002ED5C0C8